MTMSWNSVLVLCRQLVSQRHWYSEPLFEAVSSLEGLSNTTPSGVPPVTVFILWQSMVLLGLIVFSGTSVLHSQVILVKDLYSTDILEPGMGVHRLTQALSAQTVIWLHTRHYKHKLCNLNSSYCTRANKPCCAARSTSFPFCTEHSYVVCKLGWVMALRLWTQAEGLFFVHIHPSWQLFETYQHVVNYEDIVEFPINCDIIPLRKPGEFVYAFSRSSHTISV